MVDTNNGGAMISAYETSVKDSSEAYDVNGLAEILHGMEAMCEVQQDEMLVMSTVIASLKRGSILPYP